MEGEMAVKPGRETIMVVMMEDEEKEEEEEEDEDNANKRGLTVDQCKP